MKGQQVDSCVLVLVKSKLSVTVDWRAGGVGQRSTRGAKAPGGAHEPAGACSPQTPPDHRGDPQGSTIGARQVFGVVARGFFRGGDHFMFLPIFGRGPAWTRTPRQGTCRPWWKMTTSPCVYGQTSRRTPGLFTKAQRKQTVLLQSIVKQTKYIRFVDFFKI